MRTTITSVGFFAMIRASIVNGATEVGDAAW
jgi:hypothetical protein